MNVKTLVTFLFLSLSTAGLAQEGLPVYSDYLSDNLYLIHPSMAGAANCAKVRLTGRQQWFGQQDAPALQTLSFNGRVGERSGVGFIAINDRNGYHSYKGAKLTYAHHLLFSRDEIDLNQLSFGVNVGFFQSTLDETTFYNNNPTPDPIIAGIVQTANYFNVDIGASYNYLDYYVHFTVHNAIQSNRYLYTSKEPTDLKRFILNTGYTFGEDDGIQWEPSVMFQRISATKETNIDLNMKLYKSLEFGRVWGGLSYRRSLDGAQYVAGTGNTPNQKLQYVSPLIGVNYKSFMFAYTYSYLVGDVKFDNAGFHQITVGLNLFCKAERYHCNCPAIN
jgi:type IX secretion system PorP/SprF family membrane protein